jgi:HAD superfamily hydrolase (TIGR01549 family)
MTRTEVLVFDLFGTLVFFDDSRVPTMEIGGRRVPMTVADLPAMLDGLGLPLDAFLRELRRAGEAIFERKRREGIEIPTAVRFENALLALGLEPATAGAAAREMAARHMDSLARSVVCPPGRVALLEALAREHRLALLSNFDSGATARRVLAEARLAKFLEVIVISEEEGLRKPSRELYDRTCSRLGAAPARCLYIGDTLVEDIEGSTAAGLGAVWIRSSKSRAAAGSEQAPSPALAVLEDVSELPAWLEARSPAATGAHSGAQR